MSKLVDVTIAAEDAPIGVQLWPTLSPESAPDFTLTRVSVVRNAFASWVVWTYMSGQERTFQPGESVVVRVLADQAGAVTSAQRVGTAIKTTKRARDAAATRTRSTTWGDWITATQEATLRWYATGDINHVRGIKPTAQTRQRLNDLKLIERSETTPYYRATENGKVWLTNNTK
jgi:hypothetical protein